MSPRSVLPALGAGLLLCLLVLPPPPTAGQTAQARGRGAQTYSPPRLADGRPDLQGMYDLATLTPLQRPAGVSAVLSPDAAAKLEQAVARRNASASLPTRGERQAPPRGGDGSTGAAGGVGGYNAFWLDAGSEYTVVNGEIRTSIIVDPPDGRIPPLTAAARQRNAARIVRTTSDATQSRDVNLEAGAAYDDPERRPLGERCLLGFGSTSGPPVLPTYFYNNLHQIVQTPDYVMILSEMVHDARIVRMNAEHLPRNIRKWNGDSIGRWEGDTLVVETTNFTDKTRFQGAGEDLKVTERFTRVGPDALLYRFTIEDPTTWARSWTGEYTWPATNDLMYEYACHESNYALENILRGARRREADAAAAKPR